MNTVSVPVHMNVNYIVDLNRKITEQQQTIRALTEIVKCSLGIADKTRPAFRNAVENFHLLWARGQI